MQEYIFLYINGESYFANFFLPYIAWRLTDTKQVFTE